MERLEDILGKDMEDRETQTKSISMNTDFTKTY